VFNISIIDSPPQRTIPRYPKVNKNTILINFNIILCVYPFNIHIYLVVGTHFFKKERFRIYEFLYFLPLLKFGIHCGDTLF
jgi:hypothetical protein